MDDIDGEVDDDDSSDEDFPDSEASGPAAEEDATFFDTSAPPATAEHPNPQQGHPGPQPGFPRLQRVRCNLTALSQKYNVWAFWMELGLGTQLTNLAAIFCRIRRQDIRVPAEDFPSDTSWPVGGSHSAQDKSGKDDRRCHRQSVPTPDEHHIGWAVGRSRNRLLRLR